MSPAAAVVLAAGAGSRFGGPKQRLLLPEVLARVGASPVAETVVVEGAHPLGDLVPAGARVRVVRCPAWAEGPGVSLRCGLGALGDEVEVAVVILADGPRLAPGSVGRVLDAWRAGPDDVVAASYGGVRGHPVAVGRGRWEEVPDEGLRALPARLVPCDDLGAPGDVDEPADLAG